MRSFSISLMSALILSGAAWAQSTTKSTSNRVLLLDSHNRLLDGRLSQQYEASARFRVRADEAIIPPYRGKRSEYEPIAREAARRHRVPEDLFLRLVRQESDWNPAAVSSKGAIGLAQLMPQTAADLGVNAQDPVQNLDGGARYLAAQYQRFGTWRLALAAYNAGPEAVARHSGVPPFRETQEYVQRILEMP